MQILHVQSSTLILGRLELLIFLFLIFLLNVRQPLSNFLLEYGVLGFGFMKNSHRFPFSIFEKYNITFRLDKNALRK